MNAALSRLRLLIVDDHPLMRAGIRAALRGHFAEAFIAEAGDAKEALVRIAAHRPDVLVLDVNLPGMNGLDLARHIRAQDGKARILIVAADVDPWTVAEAVRMGVLGFVSKTNTGEHLPAALRSVAAGQPYFCPDALRARHRAEQHGTLGDLPPGPAVLTAREREVLRYFAQGENAKTIAANLGISPNTAQTHRQHIMRKLGIHSLASLTRYAFRHGLAQP
jgi:DNA-binding NarL/FixJ family response regulator